MLGNTETTGNNNGGSNAKSQTQRKDQLEITRSDIKYLSGWLNSEFFLAILQSYGYPVSGGKFTFEKEIDVDVVGKQITIVQQVKTMGVPVGDDYVYDLTGIPKPDDYEAQKKKNFAEAQSLAPSKPQPPKKQPLSADTERSRSEAGSLSANTERSRNARFRLE